MVKKGLIASRAGQSTSDASRDGWGAVAGALL